MLLFIVLFQVSFSNLYELLLHFQINIFIIVFVPTESWGDVDDSQYKCIGARKKPHHIALGKRLFIVICCGQGIKQTVCKLNHLNSKLKLVLLRASKDWELHVLVPKASWNSSFFLRALEPLISSSILCWFKDKSWLGRCEWSRLWYNSDNNDHDNQ